MAGSRLVPIATSPPGPRFCLEIPLCRLITSALIGFSPFFVVLPGLISNLSPILTSPLLMVPPNTPPLIFFGAVPGLFMSNDLAIFIWKSFLRSFFGVGNNSSMACISKSMFLL